MDKECVKKEAKQIMDNFMGAMKDIHVENKFVLKRDACFREEGEGEELDEDFQQRFLENAPKISGNAIVSKKGEWIK